MKMNATNIYLKFLIRLAKKTAREENASIWRDVAELLARSNRRRAELNVAKLNRSLKNGGTAIVPGKVLGDGYLDKGLTVAALGFSQKAKEKIKDANGKAIRIEELIEENPKGTGVRIVI